MSDESKENGSRWENTVRIKEQDGAAWRNRAEALT